VDLPVIQMPPTISNKELEKYKELYSQLTTEFVELYNENLVFVKLMGRDIGFSCRKRFRNMENLLKQIKKQSQLVNKENLANVRAEAKLKKIQRKKNTSIPPKRTKKVKIDNQ
jgi:hypothetical protein